ncbi:MAG: serine/threonine-protein kinase, partial [Chloroflexota bacterium]
MIGQTLNNRYEITAAIGKGAMGEVYRATDKQTGGDVAVKLMAGQLAFDADMVERFRREGEALRQLRHPNIVGLVDTFLHENRPASVGGQADGNAVTFVDTPPKESPQAAVGGPAGGDALTMVDTFPRESRQVIVLEYVPGGSLHALLKREAPLDIPRVRQIALDLCDALIRAHRLNIVHRDIKPENVLMAEDGTPRLTDFGVARLVGDATRLTGTGTQIGTPYYMSPEAWEGEQLDAQSDIWSLGIMLYEMLSGQVPFGGETMAAVMNKVLTAPLPDLRSVRPEAPDGLVQIIERMLTRDKSARYQSMREVAADLERGHPLEA